MSNCPVPDEQQPLNEYLALKESFFFRWGALDLGAYVKVAVYIWAAWWLVAAPVSASSFSPSRHLPEFLCLGAIGATLGLCLPLVRLWLGWIYIKGRLQNPTVLYEETGWYDGQTWSKPEPELQKDRLLVSYEVQPILNKIKLTLITLGSVLIIQIALLQVLI
jgi:Conserved in the green lineage and diatoms 27